MTREEAIKIIRREYSCVDRDCDIERSCGKCPYSMPSKEPILKAYCLAVEALELVTSYEGTINKLTEALNQRKEGEWIVWDTSSYDWTYKCDKCGHISLKQSNYCPNCGAKMESEE